MISEEILLQRLKVGDGAAFEELTRRYETGIYNFHCWFTGDLSLAEDLTQETFTAIWRGLGRFKGEAKLSTWIHRIARNVALQNARKRKVETVPLEQIREKTATDCTADAAERELFCEEVRAALVELPQEQREALVLNKLSGLSHSEVAQILSRPLGTIKWQIAQALQSLRSSLQRRGVTDEKCDFVREKAYTRGSLVRWRAWLHLRWCADCRQWRAEQRATEKMLESLPRYSLPAGVQNSIRGGIPAERDNMFKGGREMKSAILQKPATLRSRGLAVKSLAILVVLAAIVFWLAASKRGSAIAWAQMTEALARVQTVHITGFTYGYTEGDADNPRPVTTRKDKWLRKEPYGVREDVTMETAPPEAKVIHYTFAADPEKTYWYFPDKHRLNISRPIKIDFIEEMTTQQGWQEFAATDSHIPWARQGELNGKPVVICVLREEQPLQGDKGWKNVVMQLSIDPESKRVMRAEEFGTDVKGQRRTLIAFDFEYNVTPPPGTFEFTPPPGTKIIDKLHSR